MNTKKCYLYDKTTREYLREEIAFESPLEPNVFPLPANCTYLEPITCGEFEVSVFENGEWVKKADYRQRNREGGKPYYNPSDYWWAEPQYMTTIGDIPSGMSFTKIDKPTDAVNCRTLIDEVEASELYLDSTDKNYIELQAYEGGYRQYLTEEDVAELRAIEVQRDTEATSIRPKNVQIASLKEQIKATYGEEALNHI